MANAKHLELLRQGVRGWNEWREKNPEIKPDLNGANLRRTDLRDANLRDANLGDANLREVCLIRANLRETDLSSSDLSSSDLSGLDLRDSNLREVYLIGANLSASNLSGLDLSYANLSYANLSYANLSYANLGSLDLSYANLSFSDLSDADLSGAYLSEANLENADLSGAYLSEANLENADLSGANLSRANLSRAQVLGTNFEKSILTGACLEDWNINSATIFKGTVCEYVYLKANQQERRPREDNFQPGEFAALFQQAVDTVDLIFKDGIDWQAFFQSFQDLRSQYDTQDLSIQAIEKKRGGAFVIRLEVPPEVDKTVIESRAKELYYASQVKALEAQYEERLRLQGQYLEDARQTIEVERRDKATLMGVMSTMASTQQGPKYDMRGAQIAGSIADTVQGSQYGGINNNYGLNTEDITRLLTTLRDQAQTFPTDKQDEALDTLHNLERDLQEDQPDQGRISRRLKKLVAIATSLTDFTNNVIELTEKLGIPIEQVQLPPSSNP
ncbi:MAG: pentapeptide repeat-containing protein [Cyanobacteria bacterium P01_H01_bin.105]